MSLVSGHAFSLALTERGRLYGWGRNDQGQLGQGASMALDVYSMAVSASHAAAHTPATLPRYSHNEVLRRTKRSNGEPQLFL